MHTLLIVFTWLALQSPVSDGYQIGDVVKNFTLINTVNDKNVSLSDYKNQEGVIVIFTCNHCPYSKAYESRIMDLDTKFSKQGYPVLAISPNDPERQPEDAPDKMKQLAKQKGYSFPYLFDNTQEVARAFGATRTPHVFILQKVDAGFKLAYIGAIDDNTDDASAVQNKYVENAIANLKKGIKPEPEFTKAIGCTIKWKSSETR